MASKPVIIIGDKQGDTGVINILPGPFKGLLRNALKNVASQRKARLIHTAQVLYPVLQTLEEKSMDADMQVLRNISFEAAMHNDMCLERCLRLFQSAWAYGVIRILDGDGNTISAEHPKTIAAACGDTVQVAQEYFINIALELMFKKDPGTLARVWGTVHNPDSLPKMRLLTQFEEIALGEMMIALGPQAGAILSKIEPERIYSLALLTPVQIRALKQSLTGNFHQICEWEGKKIRALAKYFNSVEQITDLGPALLTMDSAEAIMAVGQWKKRDVSEKFNMARQNKGLEPLRGSAYDTDILFAKKFLGSVYDMMITQPADIVQGVGKLVAAIQQSDKAERSRRADEIRAFASRFMEYLTTDTIRSLGIAGEKPTTFGEATYILDGLFSKQGLGRKFFEGPLQTPEGALALHKLKDNIDRMRRGGTIKNDAEVSVLIANSDMLNEAISEFIVFK